MKVPKLKPRKKQIIIEQYKEESRVSEHGLVTPGNVEQERKAIGTVIAVGAEIDDVGKGDRVVFGAFSGDRIKFNGSSNEYVILFDDEVLALIEE